MPYALKYWEAHSAFERLENRELLGSSPRLTSIFLYLWVERLDPPSGATAVIESCLALLLLVFHVALLDGALALMLNKCLSACRSWLSLSAAPSQRWLSGC